VGGAAFGSGSAQRLLECDYEMLLLQARGRHPLAAMARLESMERQLRVPKGGPRSDHGSLD
jgi:hypothetical protein